MTVSNGSFVDAIGGQLSEFEQGAVSIGDFVEAATTNVNVTVTGEGSAIQAQRGIFVENRSDQAIVNITDGGAVKQLEPGFVFDGKQEPGIVIDSFDANGAQWRNGHRRRMCSSRRMAGFSATGRSLAM